PTRRSSDLPLVGAAHPAVQLVEVGEAEQVGALHYQRVDLGEVETRLDDRGGDEHVVLPVPEVEHHLLELSLRHLAVGHDVPGVRHQFTETGHGSLDGPHTVVNVEDLPLTEELASDGGGHCLLVVGADIGENRVTVFGRGPDVRDVPDAGEGHLQGPRDRGGGQGEDVDAYLETLQPVLGGDTESLLLIDDEQAQVLEGYVVRQETVGADHEVDLAGGETLDHPRLLLRGEESGQDLDPDRIRGEALREGLVVLLRQERRRAEDGDLPPVLDRLERGADGH